jgi:protein-disulfide isomerase
MTFPFFSSLPGIRIGSGGRDVKLDLFFDLQCPYSKKAWDVIGESVQNGWPDQFSIYFQPICLSHHRQSWDLTRALLAIDRIDVSRSLAFIDHVYSNQEQFYNADWRTKGQDEFLNYLATSCQKIIDLSVSEFVEKMESDDNYSRSKKSIHYAAIKQVWSTPTFMFNDVPAAELDSSSSIDDWNRFISGLDFSSSRARA